MMMYNNSKIDSGTMWLLFLFLGWSYGSMDEMGKQILFYITLGGLGLWGLYRLFTLSTAVKKYNSRMATRAGLDIQTQMSMGLL